MASTEYRGMAAEEDGRSAGGELHDDRLCNLPLSISILTTRSDKSRSRETFEQSQRNNGEGELETTSAVATKPTEQPQSRLVCPGSAHRVTGSSDKLCDANWLVGTMLVCT
jgi:hypothetical protein